MFVSNWESIAGVILTRIDLKSSEKMSDLFSLMLSELPFRTLHSREFAAGRWLPLCLLRLRHGLMSETVAHIPISRAEEEGGQLDYSADIPLLSYLSRHL